MEVLNIKEPENLPWWVSQPAPTDKQIKLVEQITSCLRIDFPQSSKDYTKYYYAKFIGDYLPDLKQWQKEARDANHDEEYYSWMGIDVWTPEDCY